GWTNLFITKRQRELFDLMVKNGIYSNNIDVKWASISINDRVTVDYVVKTYAEIPDSAITWTESDIRAYYNKHKKDRDYKQETSRSVEYIKFPVVPTSGDSADVRNSLLSLSDQLKSAPNDSAFATTNATTPGLAYRAYTFGSLAEPFNMQVLTDTVGDLVGPYSEGSSLKISKITKRVEEVDSVQARHILLKEKGDIAKVKADSLKKVILKENNFAAMAAIYGTDGTKDKGGDLGMFARGNMVKEFENACFNGKVGEVQIVETSFGVHLVEVTKKNAPRLVTYLSTIDKPIEASPATRTAAYNQVSEFTINYGDSASFRNAADTLNGGVPINPAKNIRPNATNISGLSNADKVVQWAYSSKVEVGEVSPPLQVESQWIVALLTEIKEKGVPTLENVYDRVKDEVIKDKKAEKYAEMMKSGATLQDIATAASSTVKRGENITLKSTNIPGSGVSQPENELIGVCFGLKKDFISSPIKGKGGIYVVQRTADIIEGSSADNYASDRENLANSLQSRAGMGIFNSMKEEANIVDNRFEQN
ncbi:MAG: peptidylprolyl isomerase, partial [Crocinitomicaceae bacterium]|nr:peptidylprolyl isomerase [Crocinitomicaceae bacterium]